MSWRDEMYTANEKALQAEVRRLRNVVRDLEDQIDQLRKENPDWIPVSTGNFPKDEEKVLVTYLGYDDNKPYCDEFAYRYNGEWYWYPDQVSSKVPITAWRPVGKAYEES